MTTRFTNVTVSRRLYIHARGAGKVVSSSDNLSV